MEYKNLYNSISDDMKLKFLEAILDQNKDIQKQFSIYVKSADHSNEYLSFQEFVEEVEDTKVLYLDFFDEIDTENPDLDNYVASHSGYMEDWEVYQEASEQEVREIFEHFRKMALDTIISQKPDKLLAMLTGLFLAVQQADIEDPIESFDDFNDHLEGEFNTIMSTVIEKVTMSPLEDSAICSALSLFLRYCDIGYPRSTSLARNFEDLLTVVSEKSNSTGKLLSIIDQSSIKREELPVLSLLLLKQLPDQEEWLQMARQTYRNNMKVAMQLLEYYYENDLNNFRETSRELFDGNKRWWALFLQNYVTPEMDQSLYVDVFFQLTIDQNKIEHYWKIREFLSDAEKNDMIGEMSWSKTFIVQILEIEGRYEDIKKFVKSTWSERDFPDMIRPILKIYPEFCFNEITQRVREALEARRGRGTYRTIVNWLKLLQDIPGFFNEKQKIITELYNHKPNLPALKDELRRAGLVN